MKNEPIPKGMHVLHKCDNPSCVRVSHLFLGTIDDNNKDRARKGRSNTLRGSKNQSAKLVESSIPRIRELHSSGLFSQEEIGDMFGVTQKVIHGIVRGKSWTHV
jgi:hypothetical protein